METIRLVEASSMSVKKSLQELDISRSTFYNWYGRYQKYGYDGLADRKPTPRKFWNKIPENIKEQVVDIALEHSGKSPRELAWHITDTQGYFLSESSVYRILKSYDLITSPAYIVLSAKDKFENPTKKVNELWQTDFSYFKIIGWGWYYLSTVMDDYSRYILAWMLSSTMSANDVQKTLDMALKKARIDHVKVKVKPRLLSDNGPSYISKDLKQYLEQKNILHIRGAPYHPQTQGKIERYHRSLKNVINLEHYYFPEVLKKAIADYVNFYNNERYHESINNLRPADVYFNRSKEILTQRQIIKMDTMRIRKYQNLGKRMNNTVLDYQKCLS